MDEDITSALKIEEATPEDLLEHLAREGARGALQAALEEEVSRFLQRFSHLRDGKGRRLAIRNGHLPERTILSGIGPLLIHQPRIDDRKLREAEGVERFSSAILPRFMRRMPSVEGLIPVLYLKGISTGDFGEALAAILGEGAKGLSATNITRMKEGWLEEHRRWSTRSLEGEEFVYLWVDGIHINVRLDDERVCLLLIIGATREGKKVLVAVSDGYRESKESWRELLLDLKHRGLKMAGKLAIGDGALGFWAAAGEVFPGMKHQRCWVHYADLGIRCTKQSTFWTRCPRACRARPRACCTRCGRRQRRRRPWRCTSISSLPGGRSTPRQRNACARTRKNCSRSMTFLPYTGCISGRPTRSSPHMRR
jgi:putative transposase